MKPITLESLLKLALIGVQRMECDAMTLCNGNYPPSEQEVIKAFDIIASHLSLTPNFRIEKLNERYLHYSI